MVGSWAKVLVFVLGGTAAAVGTAYYTGLLSPLVGDRVPVVAQMPAEDSAPASPDSDAVDDEDQPGDERTDGRDADASADEEDAQTELAARDADTDADAQDEGTANDDDEVIVPAFELLRVQPDGGVVVAGRAAPGADVEIQEGDSVLAVARAGAGGDFAAVLDEALEPGDYQLVLRATNDDLVVTSTQTALVSIPEERDGQVLALVDEPGEATRLISVPESEETADLPQERMDALVEQAEEDVAAAQPEPDSTADGTDEGAAGEAAASDDNDTAQGEAPATDEPAAQEPASDETASDTATADGQDGDEQEPAAQTDAADGQPQADAETDIAAADAEPSAETAGDPAGQQPQAATPDASSGVIVEAVEIEGEMIFVAGRATPGLTVRVYANNDFLGDARVAPNGAFLVDVRRNMPVGDYIIRADLLDASGAVLARAAVPFAREEGENVAAVAPQLRADDRERDAPAVAGPQSDDRTGQADMPEPPVTEDADVRTDAPDEDAGEERIATAPARPAASDDAGSADAGAQTGAAGEADRAGASAAPDTDASPSADQSRMAAAPSTDADLTAQPLERVDGSVIIRRGDTLWQISRRVYGRGVRYSTIYLANQDQIRDPDLIWPGQIFAVPGETEEGEPADLETLEEQAVIGGSDSTD